VIVVDTNVIAYLYLPTEYTPLAERLLVKDPAWVAPLLWRSEFRNVLALYLRQKRLEFDQAYAIQTEAEALLAGREFDVGSLEVLRLTDSRGCSAYDCEYIALAEYLGVRLVTVDRQILSRFRAASVSLRNAVR